MKISKGCMWGKSLQDYYMERWFGEIELGLETSFFYMTKSNTRPYSEVLLQVSLAFLNGRYGDGN